MDSSVADQNPGLKFPRNQCMKNGGQEVFRGGKKLNAAGKY